jgi:prevent-host-death family protein
MPILLVTMVTKAMPMAKQRRIAAGEFKARCLRILDEVQEEGVEYVVTKRGKEVARVSSAATGKKKADPPLIPRGYGSMRGTGRILGDIISPVADPDDWTADEHNLGNDFPVKARG